MLLLCKNCGSFFTPLEANTRKSPTYPWRLTESGARALAEIRVSGIEAGTCPTCGHATLVPANRASVG